MAKAYIGISVLLLADLILWLTYGISLSGQISDRILFWSWLIMTPIVIVKYFTLKWTKLYLGTICMLLIASFIPMAVPFLTIASFAMRNNHEKEIGNYRLREGAKSVIAIPKISLIKKIGIFEKEIGETDFYIEIGENKYRLTDFDEIKMYDQGDSLSLEFRIGGQIKKIRLDQSRI